MQFSISINYKYTGATISVNSGFYHNTTHKRRRKLLAIIIIIAEVILSAASNHAYKEPIRRAMRTKATANSVEL